MSGMKRLLGSVSRLRGIAPDWAPSAAITAIVACAPIATLIVFVLYLSPPSGGNPSLARPGSARPPAALASGTAGTGAAAASPAASGTGPGAVAFRGVVLPDLMIVTPGGLNAVQADEIKAVSGVRDTLVFDGGQIRAGGHLVSAAGVEPGQFRSWVPLQAASDEALWRDLAGGDFLAASGAASRLELREGYGYQLSGAAGSTARFGGAADLGISGIDLLVNSATSRRLGLAPRVGALVSAPGVSMDSLIAAMRDIVGTDARLLTLRSPQPSAAGGPITTYLRLFQASAAKYCPAISWTILAAIAQIESADGQNNGPSAAGALGPMQFLPSTWAAWGITGFGQAGAPDVMNPLDAVPAAARMLCADGASAGTAAGLRQAIYAYNHANWYVDEVLALAARYAATYH